MSLVDLACASCEQDIESVRDLLDNTQVKSKINDFFDKQHLSIENDVNVANQTSAIHVACAHSTHSIVTLLVASGARTDQTDSFGNLPVHCACWSSIDVVEKLEMLTKRDRTCIQLKDNKGRTPLHIASGSSAPCDVIELLLRRGASTDAADDDFDRPIHFACWSDMEAAVKSTC